MILFNLIFESTCLHFSIILARCYGYQTGVKWAWLWCARPPHFLLSFTRQLQFSHCGLQSCNPPLRMTPWKQRDVSPMPSRHGASSGWRGEDCLQMWRVTANILNVQSRTAKNGRSFSPGFGPEYQLLTVKSSLLQNVTQDLGFGRILWNDPSNHRKPTGSVSSPDTMGLLDGISTRKLYGYLRMCRNYFSDKELILLSVTI
jgi:hypothetical protein